MNHRTKYLTHYRRQILDSSELKDFADDNLKFDKNGRKLSKRVENTVGKGEIARYEQFLLFPQCFQKTCFPGASKGVIVWESVKLIAPHSLEYHMRLNNFFKRFQQSFVHHGNKSTTCHYQPSVSSCFIFSNKF